jgi:hypothetical protein
VSGLPKCASCGAELAEGDDAFERDVRRIEVEGTRVQFVNDVEIVCVPCAKGAPR